MWDGITRRSAAQWDVDNDGDGVPDSVWVDLGLPVRYTADGQAYKPLFAILCLDMDGRLNLNAHGCYAQTQQAYYNNNTLATVHTVEQPARVVGDSRRRNRRRQPRSVRLQVRAAYFAGSGAATSPIALPRGQGTGTAEVNLLPLSATRRVPVQLHEFQLCGHSVGSVLTRHRRTGPWDCDTDRLPARRSPCR